MRSLWEGKTIFKMLLTSWFFVSFFKRSRSFNDKNLGSVGQRAANLPAIKVGGLKKKSAFQPRPHSNWPARVGEQPVSNHFQSLMAGKFAALWSTDPKFSSLKDLNLLKKYTKDQEASCILKVVFALTKWPHLHNNLPKSRFLLLLTALYDLSKLLECTATFNHIENWKR